MKTFTRYHLAITKNQHQSARDKWAVPAEGLNILEVTPDYDTFARLIARLGGPWGWTKRPRYAASNRLSITKLLKKPHTRLFLLRSGEKTLGYCLTATPQSAQNRFRPEMIEIENFGLFPEHTGKKYGLYFLPAILEELFADHNVVYLSTRSTNHARVVPFYENLGMRVIRQETLPDDLIPAPASGLALPA